MTSVVTYDVRDVLPFPLEHDPNIDGMKRKTRSRRKRCLELPPELEAYRLYTIAELGQFPPVRWLIDSYLAAGELTVFYGRGDTYKSFVALDWSCGLAQQRHVVVYIVAEGASGMRARVRGWMKRHGLDDLPGLLLMPANVNLHRPEDAERWLKATRAQLKNRSPALVVVDTLARNFVGGNESSPQDMGLFVEGVERVRRELGTAVLVLHHSTKDDKAERGTESLRNASFAMFEFKRKSAQSVDVRCDRMKDAEPPDTRRIQPVRVSLPELTEERKPEVSTLVANWAHSPAAKARITGESADELSPDDRRLLGAFARANRRAKGATPAELRRELKWSATKLNAHTKSLVAAGFLQRQGETRQLRYWRTEKQE